MNLIIDASNLRDGGGITHISEILNNVTDENILFKKVYIFSNTNTLTKIKDRDWLIKKTHPYLQKSLLCIVLWKFLYFEKFLSKARKNSILLDPTGTYSGKFRPYIAMSQNMLVFDSTESGRYGISWMKMKFFLLKILQIKTFENANQIIFLSNYAKNWIAKHLKKNISLSPIIHHGVNPKFLFKNKSQKNIEEYNNENPFKFLYVSTITVYKHQRLLIQAIKEVRDEGIPITIDLVGGSYAPELKKFLALKNKLDPHNSFVFYRGKSNYENIEKVYKNCDGIIFASTCENMPNILIESMTSRSPIMSSNYGPMPEFLGDNFSFYFDPTNKESIKKCIYYFLNSTELRQKSIENCARKTKQLTWSKCADQTFSELYSSLKEATKTNSGIS
jgi:glycosyltransferase involved in cell wall biosynthesis